jgi:hypothetical protein
MLRSAIKSIQVRTFLLTYLAIMLVLYPVSRMYANEYETIPIKFEFAVFMVLVGLICNSGLVLALSRWGLLHKKITYPALVFTALMNALLLLLTNGNPLHFVSYEYWNAVRYLCFYGVLLVGVVLCVLVGGHQDESR